MRTTRLAPALALLLALLPTPASAQAASPACGEPCPPSDLFCAARQHVCHAKLDVYRGYMAGLARGVVLHELPPGYRELLQPHFPGLDLAAYRFGFADRQPPGNAVTDCDRTYYGDADFVDALRAGHLAEDAHFDWLFHELAHVRQCREVGGRDGFAQMWFRDLGAAVLGSRNPLALHERMPMEREAADEARRTLEAVRAARDGEGRLMPPPWP